MHRLLASILLLSSTTAFADARFVAAIRKAAGAYQHWGRVDESPNIAPDLCRAPMPADYGVASRVRLSQADDAPHGQKLYYLWASDRFAYRGLDHEDLARPAVGFSIVKQSFSAKTLEHAPANPAVEVPIYRNPAPITWLETDGKILAIDRPKDLFVMTKVGDDDAPGTDHGWIYGTVAPDGTVTSAGRVERCMQCHDDAPHERLFGPRSR